MKRKKRIKNRRRVFVIGAYWILLTGLLGMFASPFLKYSADSIIDNLKYSGNVSTSVKVIDNINDNNGVAGATVSAEVTYQDTKKVSSLVDKTGSKGFSNDGGWSLGLNSENGKYYIYKDGVGVISSIKISLLDADNKTIGNPVTQSVYGMDQNQLVKSSSNSNQFYLPTVRLYQDRSAAKILTATESSTEDSDKNLTDSSSTTKLSESSDQEKNTGVNVGVPIPAPGNSAVNNKTSYTYDEYICAIYYWALNIGFGLTLLMIVYAGYRYMTAAGNDSVFSETKDVLTNAILGFVLLLCIRLVLHFLHVPEPGKCFANDGSNKNTNASIAFAAPKEQLSLIFPSTE